MGLFGSSKKEMWTQFAAEIGANYQPGGIFKADVFCYHHKNWEFSLNSYATDNQTYTTLTAPFEVKDAFQLKIYKEGFFSNIGKLFNMQDIQIQDSEFDSHFIIKGDNEERIKRLLSNSELKKALMIVHSTNASIKIDNGRSLLRDRYPEHINALVFQCPGIVTELETLRDMFHLFKVFLDALVEIRATETRSPSFSLHKEY